MSKKRNKATKAMKSSTSFGRHLAGARRERGWDLDELQQATKVSRTMLEALENEDFEQLPAEVYARGFVRSCAQALGLDAQELLGRYERAKRRYDAQKGRESHGAAEGQAERDQPQTPASVSADRALEAWAAAASRRKADRQVVGGSVKSGEESSRPRPAKASKGALSSSPRRVSLALVLLLIIVALTLTISYMMNRPHSSTSDSGTPAATETANSADWTG